VLGAAPRASPTAHGDPVAELLVKERRERGFGWQRLGYAAHEHDAARDHLFPLIGDDVRPDVSDRLANVWLDILDVAFRIGPEEHCQETRPLNRSNLVVVLTECAVGDAGTAGWSFLAAIEYVEPAGSWSAPQM
jgi:hypothetical protein